MKALIDTNILVDSHAGVEAAAIELSRYDQLAISRIVWIEFFAGALTPAMRLERQLIANDFELLEISPEVATEAVLIRQKTRLKLPDAIILATARVHGLLFVTRNHRDFPRREPDIRIPY
jgi:predicted nucleic acid-binding protein